ncbi:OLC1v1030936C1 [Oldenlandia corymbosa var. corymbosa]|uniref:OLC1v1030936C1 n=1 Tax=Oldenlandia corymbosa var. corymbosa TaxID=529605 RepID=A0AAV1CI09_OLDCO|nr:OLC1v1030936C1 [Oldenlandia corymbosa var. corymbosa]
MLPLTDFNDPTKGTLIHDECLFGVEISVCNYSGKVECVPRPTKLEPSFIYTWKVANYSTLPDLCSSPEFAFGNHQWVIILHPRGFGSEKGKSISFHLQLDDTCVRDQVYTEWKLRIKDQIHACHCEEEGGRLFSSTSMSWGWRNFLSLDDFHDASKGFLVKHTFIVELEITRVSTIRSFS